MRPVTLPKPETPRRVQFVPSSTGWVVEEVKAEAQAKCRRAGIKLRKKRDPRSR
jgi:hypothetical protein